MKKMYAVAASALLAAVFAMNAAAEEPVSFSFVQAQPEFQTAAQNLVAAYEAEFPNVTIELITQNDSLDTDLQTGNIPDIFYTGGYGQIAEYADYIEDLSDQPWVESIVDTAIPAITRDGKVYAFPWTFSSEAIAYNKAMFEENGWEVPTTVSELKALCETIQEAGITPFVNEFADDWLIGNIIADAGYTNIPDVADFDAKLKAGEVKFSDAPELQYVFDTIDLMLEYGAPDPLSYGWTEACTAFALGDGAMLAEGDWIWSTIEAIDPDIQVGFFPLPVTDDPANSLILSDVNQCLHIGKGSKNPEAAKEFMNWMATSDTARKIMLEEYQITPCFEGWEFAGTNQLAASASEYVQNGQSSIWWFNNWPVGFREACGAELQKYIDGSATREEVLAAWDAAWDNITMS